MKAPLLLSYCLLLLFASCSKSSSGTYTGTWRLKKKEAALGASSFTYTPTLDSSVRLTLSTDHRFKSTLGNKLISEGSYTVTKDSVSPYPALELDDFQTTGIFSLPELYQVSPTGQIISEYHGMSIQVSGNTLTLTSPITPGGFTSYLFARD